MSKSKTKKVDIEIYHNQSGGLSLCISNKSGGHRLSGGKIGGCEPLKTFTVDADELIKIVKEQSYHD